MMAVVKYLGVGGGGFLNIPDILEGGSCVKVSKI